MGMYLNPGSEGFRECLNSEIYIDKSGLIAFTNRKINTKKKYMCVSRPRRFGKSMAADMLTAYYDCREDTRELFAELAISQSETFEKFINQYYVLKIDMQTFMTSASSVSQMVKKLKDDIIQELLSYFPDISYLNTDELYRVMDSIYSGTGRKFVILIDEWDCVMRRYHSEEDKKLYLDFLRNWMKDKTYVALAYMTGILPVKKYGEHSTLNMFDEYSMIDSAEISEYFGFTESEVEALCEEYSMDFAEAREWYDGYHLAYYRRGIQKICSIYSPESIVDAMLRGRYSSYWTQTETYEALKELIQKNYDGLREAVVNMLAGCPVKINTRHFQNDMSIFNSKDDVLTLLIHLGYLSYDQQNETVSVPNKEVEREFISSIENIESYSAVFEAVQQSRNLLKALWNMEQIKRKNYPERLEAYHGNLLLCGINYDKDAGSENKHHKCIIERFKK